MTTESIAVVSPLRPITYLNLVSLCEMPGNE